MDTVLQLNRELGIGVLMVTHLLEEVLVASRVGVLAGGSMVAWDTPQAVFSQESVVEQGDLVLPLSGRASLLMQERWPAFPLCLTAEDFVGAACRLN